MSANQPWYRELNRYHWFVLLVAALGWLFDTMDQQLFVLVRIDALAELIGKPASDDEVKGWAGKATAIFLIGWATGGLGFGVLGDRIGRVKTMLLTILLYSVCTGLSIFATGPWDFCFFRFLTGLGVGGEFAVGVALVAESMPSRARAYSLSLLQASSGIGNIAAALIYLGLGRMESAGWFTSAPTFAGHPLSPWRVAFLVGTIPALLCLLIRRRLKEPEVWKQKSAEKKNELGSYRALFGNPTWRKRALFGLLLGFAAVVGLWGIGFFMSELVKSTLPPAFKAQGISGDELSGKIKTWAGISSVMQNLGGMAGIIAGGILAQRIGRRPAFAIAYLAALASTAFVFLNFRQPSDVFWMVPLMGFCQLSLFGLLAMYLPELFPTSLRSTGTSFCYNVGRFVAALGPWIFGILTSQVFIGEAYPGETPFRYAGASMCVVFLLGIVALPFLPETKGKPLPE
ncbi:MAG TPA: MFS transporter [Planctomycetia bacterium]|nr:MFS transporter [Planctomycetia bacterium]